MAFKYGTSPVIHSKMTSRQIMRELTIVLAIVFVYSLVMQGIVNGMAAVLHCVLLMAVSVATALIAELLWARLALKSKDPFGYVRNSYGWITAMILVMTCRANTQVYPVVIGTLFAIVIVKMFYGGFGQNIFNPAAAGRGIILIFFTSAVTADFATGATPLASMAAYNWIPAEGAAALEPFGGLGGLLLGTYNASIGDTGALVILAAGIYLIYRRIIDWPVPVIYLGSVFLFTWIIGGINGAGLWYPLFHVLAGGTMFGAIFMITDMVTTPVNMSGKMIFSIGAALLTVLIRVRGNYPDGVLFSILLMNMLTPWIDGLTSGFQLSAKYTKDMWKLVGGFALVSLIIILVIAPGVGA